MKKKKQISPLFDLSILKDDVLSLINEQLEKDFNLCGIDYYNPAYSDSESFMESLELFLSDLYQKEPEKLRALLYRIDINETLIGKMLEESVSLKEFISNIAKAILVRQYLKIQNRNKYSN